MPPRIVFKDIKRGDAFVSVIDKVRVGRRFIVERKQHKPKLVWMWTMDEFAVSLNFTMAEINRCLVREEVRDG